MRTYSTHMLGSIEKREQQRERNEIKKKKRTKTQADDDKLHTFRLYLRKHNRMRKNIPIGLKVVFLFYLIGVLKTLYCV